jgi:superfamily II DNA helicase RecQ
MAQMQMLDSPKALQKQLKEVEKAGLDGELDKAVTLFTRFDERLRQIIDEEIDSYSEAQAEDIINLFEQLQSLTIQLAKQRDSVASQVSQLMSNKKKINAYKQT